MKATDDGPYKVLLRVACMRMAGPLAQVGEVILTEESLRFVPRGLDRAVGAEGVVIDLLDIDEIKRARGLEAEIRIRVGEEVHRFGGRGSGWLALRLRSLLLDPDGELLPFEIYERDEPVVVCGEIAVYLMGFLASRGEVILTDRRIRIRTTGGPESWIFGKRVLDCPLTEIQQVSRQGVRKAVTITVDRRRVAIGGGVTPMVAAGLGAVLIDANVPGRWDQHVALGTVTEVQLLRGPRYIPGVMAVSSRALQFTPTGRIDSAAGATDVTLDLEEIYQISMEGRGDMRLVIHTEQSETAFLVDEVERRFLGLVDTLQNIEPDAPLGHRPLEFVGPAEVDCFLSGWKRQLEPGEGVRALEWVVLWTGNRSVTFGWLLLTDRRLIFLPTAGPDGTAEPRVFVIQEMGRLTDVPDNPRLRFMANEKVIEITHRRGADFVHTFWQQCSAATVMKSSQQARQKRTLSRLEGRAAFLEVVRDGTKVLRLEEPRLVALGQGIGVRVRPEEADMLMRLGSGRIEIGRREGVYQFDMRINEGEALDEGEFLTGHSMTIFVALSPVILHNRREGFRVSVSFLVDVKFSGGIDREGKNCSIDSLSIGGITLSVPWALPNGVVAELELPILGEPLPVRLRMVRLVQEGGGVRRWRYGLAFIGLEDVDRSRINQLVLDQQRKRIRS